MATAKTNRALQAERMAQAADRLDFLAANARICETPLCGASITRQYTPPSFWASR